ncbi:MAG TPA: ABC transporter substrate-binding protein [Acidimicrobiales bacterium]|nr:ABC transporter substrate-binding protein [Acidimicrobiales bacterium]
MKDTRDRWFRALCAGVLALVVVGLAACGSSDDDVSGGSGGSEDGGDPVSGGTLTVLTYSDGNGYDPTKFQTSVLGGDTYRLYAVYDALLYADSATSEVVPHLAESMTSSDGMNWELKLRPDLEFSDGTPLDAEAVKFNWDRHVDPELASPSAPAARSLSYAVVDDTTLSVKIDAPNYQLPRIIADNLTFIGSPTAIQAASDRDDYAQHPIGAGPFTLTSYTPTVDAQFERNPTYWNAPRPYVDKLVVKTVPDETQRLNAFQSGQGDINLSNELNTVTQEKAAGPVYSPQALNTFVFWPNLAKPPFDDVRVRKALQLAIDVEQINEQVDQGLGGVPATLFPEETGLSDDSVVYPEPDLAEAQDLIDEYVAETGSDVEFTFTTATSARSTLTAQAIQAQLGELENVKMDVKSQAPAANLADYTAGNFDAFYFIYQGSDPESQFLELVLSSGTRNFQTYDNPAVDDLVVEVRATQDTDERAQLLIDMQKELIDTMPFFPLQRTPSFWAYNDNVQGMEEAGINDGTIRTDELWLK